MGAKLTFLHRTKEEVKIFGGEVYIDVDGRNVGILGLSDYVHTLSDGEHTIKMYKSHTYGTFIGVSETTLMLTSNEHLMLRYSAPMVVSQPGTIVVLPYNQQVAETEIKKQSIAITTDFQMSEDKKKESERKSNNAMAIVIAIMIFSAICWGIWYATIMSSF